MTGGERFARELLEELRRARYSPRGWRVFLARSFERARRCGRERPRARRQTLAAAAAGLAAWAGLAAAGRPALAVAGAAWWLAVVVMLDWHLGLLERPDGRPLDRLGAPNLLALARAGLVPALPALSPTALAVALAAAHAADVLDGRIARRRDLVTRLGLWLDGAVDTFVLAAGAAAALAASLLPAWAAGLALARCALPWLAVPAVYFATAAPPPSEAHVSGRAPGFVLLAGLVLAGLELPGASGLVAAGAIGGLAAAAASAARTRAERAGRLASSLVTDGSSRR